MDEAQQDSDFFAPGKPATQGGNGGSVGEFDAGRGVRAGKKQPRNVASFRSALCMFLKSGARTADSPRMFFFGTTLAVAAEFRCPKNPTIQAEHQKQPVHCNTATCTPICEGNYVSGGKPRRGSRGKATDARQSTLETETVKAKVAELGDTQ